MGNVSDVIGAGGLPVWAQTLVSWVLTYGVHSTLLLGSAWVLSRLRPFQTPAVQDVLWKTALVGGLCTASLHISTGLQPVMGTWSIGTEDTQLVVDSEDLAAVTLPSDILAMLPGDKAVFVHADGQVDVSESLAVLPEGTVFPFEEPATDWWFYGLLALWGSGVLALMWRHRCAHRQFAQTLHNRQDVEPANISAVMSQLGRQVPRLSSIRVTVSPHVASPIALPSGEICLPERVVTELDSQQQASMLAHEVAHVIRRDTWWRIGQVVVETLFFFQPLNRVASRKMREAAEFLCDDWAVTHTGSPRSLATCIHTVASWGYSPAAHVWAVGMAERHSPFLQRIQRLLHYGTQQNASAPPKRWFWGIAILWLGLMAFSSPDVRYQQSTNTGLEWYSDPNAPVEPIAWPEDLSSIPAADTATD